MKRWTHQTLRAPNRSRTLAIEPLEERRILDAAAIVAEPLAEELPWQNPVYRLDVNKDSVTNASDLLTIVNRILTQGTTTVTQDQFQRVYGKNPSWFGPQRSGGSLEFPVDSVTWPPSHCSGAM